jgi:CRISPR system Cascade subunit CasE
MLRLRIEARTLAALAERRRLPRRADDTGYLVHSFLRELFGEMAPSPFSVEREQGRMVDVLAYSATPADQLRRHAETLPDPFHYAGVDWPSFKDKRMPDFWRAGHILGFKVRVCPVVRRAKAGPQGQAAGREMDVFLTKLEANPDAAVDRYQAYLAWLREAFQRSGGASLLQANVSAFHLRRLVRRDNLHEPGLVPAVRTMDRGASGRPDATIVGELSVDDPDRFAALLRRGIGRHRAFGFGMLLLRPPGKH